MNTHAGVTDETGEPAFFFVFNCHTNSLLPQTPYLPWTLDGQYCSTDWKRRSITLDRGEKVRRGDVRRGALSQAERGNPIHPGW